METKAVKKVCECKNCGNESEMEFSCRLVDTESETEVTPQKTSDAPKQEKKVKGTATCSYCGSEADMWIDM